MPVPYRADAAEADDSGGSSPRPYPGRAATRLQVQAWWQVSTPLVAVSVEFGYHHTTRHIGMLVTISGRLPIRFIGPSIGPVERWCVGAIDYLVRNGILTESERAGRLAGVRETYTDAGYTWGDDGHDRKASTLARVSQTN